MEVGEEDLKGIEKLDEVDRFYFDHIGTGWDVMVFKRGMELVLSVEGRVYPDAVFPVGTSREVLKTKATELVNRIEFEFSGTPEEKEAMGDSSYQFILTLTGSETSMKSSMNEVSEFVRREVVEIIHKVDILYGVQCSLEVKRNGNQ